MPFLRNWFDTDEAGADPGPLELPISVSEGLARIEAAIRAMSHWHLESRDESTVVVTATRKTRLFRFTDDVTLRLEATATGVRTPVRPTCTEMASTTVVFSSGGYL